MCLNWWRGPSLRSPRPVPNEACNRSHVVPSNISPTPSSNTPPTRLPGSRILRQYSSIFPPTASSSPRGSDLRPPTTPPSLFLRVSDLSPAFSHAREPPPTTTHLTPLLNKQIPLLPAALARGSFSGAATPGVLRSDVQPSPMGLPPGTPATSPPPPPHVHQPHPPPRRPSSPQPHLNLPPDPHLQLFRGDERDDFPRSRPHQRRRNLGTDRLEVTNPPLDRPLSSARLPCRSTTQLLDHPTARQPYR